MSPDPNQAPAPAPTPLVDPNSVDSSTADTAAAVQEDAKASSPFVTAADTAAANLPARQAAEQDAVAINSTLTIVAQNPSLDYEAAVRALSGK